MPPEPLQLVSQDDPILRTRCRPEFAVTRHQIEQMFFLMREKNGLGLAAPQVGIDARLFVTMWGEVFVNPRIVEVRKPILTSREGCLSLPGVRIITHRWSAVRLSDGQVFTDQKAIVIQHELDHLNGILVTDLTRPT